MTNHRFPPNNHSALFLTIANKQVSCRCSVAGQLAPHNQHVTMTIPGSRCRTSNFEDGFERTNEHFCAQRTSNFEQRTADSGQRTGRTSHECFKEKFRKFLSSSPLNVSPTKVQKYKCSFIDMSTVKMIICNCTDTYFLKMQSAKCDSRQLATRLLASRLASTEHLPSGLETSARCRAMIRHLCKCVWDVMGSPVFLAYERSLSPIFFTTAVIGAKTSTMSMKVGRSLGSLAQHFRSSDDRTSSVSP